MIVAGAKNHRGDNVIVVGLTEGDVTQMRKGLTKTKQGNEAYGFSSLVVFMGKSDEEMVQQLNAGGAVRSDMTVRKCIGFAENAGYGRVVILNLFAYRTANPSILYQASDRIGPEFDEHFREWASKCDTVICCWGVIPMQFRYRAGEIAALLPERCYCIGTTREGFPLHPSRAAYVDEFQIFNPK